MGLYQPIASYLRVIVISILLVIYQSSTSLTGYLIISCQLAYVMFIVFGRPHKKPIDTVRSFFLEISLFVILFVRFINSNVLNSMVASSSLYFSTTVYL